MICVAQTSLDYSEIRTHTKTEVFHNLLLDRAIAMVGNLGDLKMLSLGMRLASGSPFHSITVIAVVFIGIKVLLYVIYEHRA